MPPEKHIADKKFLLKFGEPVLLSVFPLGLSRSRCGQILDCFQVRGNLLNVVKAVAIGFPFPIFSLPPFLKA